MQYLKPSFTIPPPETLNGIACEACIYGTKRGEKHAADCPRALWSREDWICRSCADADPEFAQRAAMDQFIGDCERCEAMNIQLYRVPGTWHCGL